MTPRWRTVAGIALLAAGAGSGPATAQSSDGPYARIALFHPRDGHTTDFEAGYLRHLAFHQQAKDTWAWYGWNVTFGERQRWFVYATFGHSAASFDNPVDPTGDERDNVLNVTPHVDQWSNALYEYLPALSRGTGVPQPSPRLELTTVDLKPGGDRAFEAAIRNSQPALATETLWFRMAAGGPAFRYVRLRPQPSLAAVLESRRQPSLPDTVYELMSHATVDILTLRPTMSLGLGAAVR